MFVYLNTIRQRSLRMFLTVARIMLPVMAIVYIAERLGVVAWVASTLAPAMALMGLPADTGIIWVTTIVTNIYGGMATMAALSGNLDLTVGQVSALGLMMLFAHNIPTEQSIVRRAGASVVVTGCLRIMAAIVFGAAVAWSSRLTGWLSEPVRLDWMRQDDRLAQGTPDFLHWAISTVQSLFVLLLIIIGLVLLLDILERLKITQLITRLLNPVLRLSGLEARAAPLTTVGVLLGLAYGGALIIEAAQREKYSRRTLLLALSWLSLCHALIEDTLLIMALGASLWIILVLRLAVTLALIAGLAFLTRPGSRWGDRFTLEEKNGF